MYLPFNISNSLECNNVLMAGDVCIHPHWQNSSSLTRTNHFIIGLFASVLGIIAAIGNSLVIILLIRFRSLRNSANLLVLNLAIADGILSLGNFPILAISSFHGYWIFGKAGCDIYGFVGALSGFVSINTLTAIAMERCIVIVFKKPCQFNRTSSKTVLLVIILVWIYSVSWSLTPIFGWGSYVLEGSFTSCTFDFFSRDINTRSYVLSILVFCFTLQVSMIGASYFIIFFKVMSHERDSILKHCKNSNGNVCLRITKTKKREKMQLRTAKVCLMIVTIFSISWMPYAIIAIIGEFGNANLITPLSSVIPGLCAKVSTAINPIIYALLHPKFRSKLKYKISRRRNSIGSRLNAKTQASPKTSFQELPSIESRSQRKLSFLSSSLDIKETSV